MNDEIEKVENKENIIAMPDGTQMSLDGLPQEQVNELKKKYADKLIDIHAEAIEKKIKTKDIQERMSDVTETVREATADNSHATITYSTEDAGGRTEVIIGNTERAAKGKLTRSQQGKDEKLLWIFLLGIVAVLVFAIALNN